MKKQIISVVLVLAGTALLFAAGADDAATTDEPIPVYYVSPTAAGNPLSPETRLRDGAGVHREGDRRIAASLPACQGAVHPEAEPYSCLGRSSRPCALGWRNVVARATQQRSDRTIE